MGSLFRPLHALEPHWIQVLFAPCPILCCVLLCLACPSTEHRYLVPSPGLCTIGMLHPRVRQSLVSHVGGVSQHRLLMYPQRYLTNLDAGHNSNLQDNENATSRIRFEKRTYRFGASLPIQFESRGFFPTRNAMRQLCS